MRIIQIIPHSCLPPESGGQVKTASLATALALLGELHIISIDDDHHAAGAMADPVPVSLPYGGEAVYHSLGGLSMRNRFPRRLWIQSSGPRGVPFSWRPRSPRERLVWQRMEALAPDVVMADDTRWAPMAAFGPGWLRIVHTHNRESQLWSRASERHPEQRNLALLAHRFARLEQELLPRVHQVWAVQEDERQAYIRSGLDPNQVFLVPNVIPNTSFLAGPQPGEAGLAVFFGSLWYEPNADAAKYLVDLARRWNGQHVDARLVVAGRGADEALRAAAETTPGMELLGFVPDLGGLLRRAAVILLPLSWGAGTKIKTLEAMAAGKPILTTPAGAEGLDLEDGVHAVIRDLGPDFDHMALTMLRKPERFADLGRRAQDLARARFSQASLDRAVARAILNAAP